MLIYNNHIHYKISINGSNYAIKIQHQKLLNFCHLTN